MIETIDKETQARAHSIQVCLKNSNSPDTHSRWVAEFVATIERLTETSKIWALTSLNSNSEIDKDQMHEIDMQHSYDEWEL